MQRVRLPSLAPALLFVVAATAEGQITGANLTGRITDPSGAAVDAAWVELKATGSDVVVLTTSDDRGAFAYAVLAAGRYALTVRQHGFRTHAIDVIELEPGRTTVVHVVLDLGDYAEVVRVEGGSSTWVATPGVRTVDLAEVSNLPANGRNYLAQLLALPSSVTTNPRTFTGGERMTNGGRPNLNGSRREASSFLLDGVDISQHTDNLVSYHPSPDALEEVTVTTGAASAEWGNYLGGVIQTRLRSGRDVWTGSAFGFVRDERLNASNWARKWQPPDPLNPGTKTPLDHTTVGGTVGGAVLPRRLFVFADYQRVRREAGPIRGLVTFITPAMRRGDFSALLQQPQPQQLFDPATARPDPDRPGSTIRDPFPGNQIPLDRIDAVAAALFDHPLYPSPDLPGLSGNTRSHSSSELGIDQGDVRVDIRPAASSVVTGRYSTSTQRQSTESAPIIIGSSRARSPFQSGGVTWLWQPASTVANELIAGVSSIRLRDSTDADGDPLGPLGEALGVQGVNRARPGLPLLSLSGAATGLGNPGVVSSFDASTWQVSDTLTWTRGRHALKAGVQVYRYLQDVYFSGNSGQLGLFEFNGQYTRDLANPRSLGSPMADFFLGHPSRIARGDIAETWQHRSTLLAGFVQVEWRPSASLTAGLGLRYEYRTPLVEARDRQVNYNPATGAAEFAGRDGHSRALYTPFRSDWQPRLSMTWAPGRGRALLRAAYGATSHQEGTGTNLRLPLNPPYFNELELVYGNPALPSPSPGAGFDGVREKDAMTGAVLRAIDPHFRPARAHHWNLAAEHNLPFGVVGSVGYAGQVGHHLVVPLNANQPLVPGGPRPLDGVLPQIGAVILTTSIGRQRYDALQASVRRRHSNGWSLIGSYTWSHAFSDSRGFFSESGQSAEPATFWPNPRDQAAEWGPSAFDVRHTFTGGTLVDLPWGRGRRWGSAMPPWLDAIAGGWSASTLWRLYSGFAITVLAPDQSGTRARSGRPDRTWSGEGAREVGPGRLWFDTSAFVLPRSGSFGNAGTGIVRGPGLRVFDLALSKAIRTGGRSRLELRVEAFNLFNTPVFDAPDRQITSATFGQVRGSQLEREVQVGAKWVF